MARIDDAVRRILRVKFRAGLFDHPYVDQAKAADPTQLPDRRRPRRRAQPRPASRWCCSRTTARRCRSIPTQVDRRDRPARRRPARHARPVVGPGPGRGRRVGLRRASRPQDPNTTFTAGLHDRSTRTRRTTRRRTSAARTPASPPRSPRRTPPTRSCSRSARAAGMSGEAAARSDIDLPGQAAGADRRDQGDRQAVRRRAVQRPAADAGRRRRLLAGDPRGLVPGHRGRQRGRRRAVRQGQPGRQAAGLVPAQRSARSRSTTTTSRPAARAT